MKIEKRLKNIGCGCLVILIILIILGVVFSGVIIRKIFSGAISTKTGVQVNVDNVQNIQEGKLTYTDPKSGATLNIGTNKVPSGFPADFPIYPNATVTSSLSGNGFWLTLTTSDDLTKIENFYSANLVSSGWAAKSGEDSENWVVSKNNFSGAVTIEKGNNGQNSIFIVLGSGSK